MVLKLYKKNLMFLLRRKYDIVDGVYNNIHIKLYHLVYDPTVHLELTSLNEIVIKMSFPDYAWRVIKQNPYSVYYFYKSFKVVPKKFLGIDISLFGSIKIIDLFANNLSKYGRNKGNIDYKDAEYLLDCAYKNYVRKTKIEEVNKYVNN